MTKFRTEPSTLQWRTDDLPRADRAPEPHQDSAVDRLRHFVSGESERAEQLAALRERMNGPILASDLGAEGNPPPSQSRLRERIEARRPVGQASFAELLHAHRKTKTR
jgi:hypothetical protein